MTQKLSNALISETIEYLSQALMQNQRIEFREFGAFQTKIKKPKIARNPKTGEVLMAPELKTVHFKSATVLKKQLLERMQKQPISG